MDVYCFSYTKSGADVGIRIEEYFSGKRDINIKLFAKEKYCESSIQKPIEALTDRYIETIFKKDSYIIFVCALGIAIRKIAPYVKSKLVDPAVICIDEQGTYVIPVISGHLGGANKLSAELAKYLAALPVITTATDLQDKFAVDVWAKEMGLFITNPKAIKKISSAALDDLTIGLISDFPVETLLPKGVIASGKPDYRIHITVKSNKKAPENTIILAPKCIAVGMGCRKGASYNNVNRLFFNILEENEIALGAVMCLCTIDIKKDEPAFKQLCKEYDIPLITYSAEQLRSVSGLFEASAFVKRTVGVDNVCERAAVLASGGNLIAGKKAENGVTIALAQKNFVLGRQ